MSNVESFKVTSDLYLVSQSIDQENQLPQVFSKHVILWVDCSGSMSYELPKLRQQLKNKLATLVGDGDLVTVGWFSSRNQFGILFEALPVKTLRDLTDMHRAIDKFLQPIGLTGFKQPIEETLSVIKRNPNTHAISFFFQTDGYDNSWQKSEIMNAVRAIAPVVSSATFVEYGYYANRQLLTEMAEQVGGSLIFCEDFRSYEPAFEAAMGKRLQGGKKITVELEGTPKHGLTFALIGNDVVTFAPNEHGAVMVPEGTQAIYYLSDVHLGVNIADGEMTQNTMGPLYAALFLMSQRMKSNEVYALLKATGDVRLIKAATNAYGKQALSEFQNTLLATVTDVSLRLTDGYDPNLVPPEDAYTVLDLLGDLLADPEAKFYPNHEKFNYKRTGRARVTTKILTEDLQREIADLFAKAKTSRDIEKAMDRADKLTADFDDGLKFEYADKTAGYPLSNLTFNEDRPNVSMLVRMDGVVDLTELAKDNPEIAKIPGYKAFPTFRYRNYTAIKDGVVNIDVLPVSLSETLYNQLRAFDGARIVDAGGSSLGVDHLLTPVDGNVVVWPQWSPETIYLLNLRVIPVVNRKMVKAVSAKKLFELDYARTKIAAAQKVFKFFSEQNFGKRTSEGYKILFGETATEILKEAGLTDFGGFSPKGTLAEASDQYMAVETRIKLAGLSSLPSVNDVIKAMDAKKTLTISQSLMAEPINEYRVFIASDAYVKFPASKQEDLLKLWLQEKAKEAVTATRGLIRQLAEIKFGLVLGQVWPSEFSSVEENTLTMNFDGRDVKCTLEMRDIEVDV